MRDKFINTLFPRYCAGCKNIGAYICNSCKKELQPHPDRCPFCHRITLYGQTCLDCRSTHPHLQGVMVAFIYTSIVKQLILQLKFYHKHDIAEFLAQRLILLIKTNPYLTQAMDSGELWIGWVPTHRWRRYIVKGYNQSKLLADAVAQALHLPTLNMLYKKKHTASQIKLSKNQRAINLVGAFEKKTSTTTSIPTRGVLLLVDDITTTGATLEEIAKQRKKYAPGIRIRGVVVGRHGK